MNIKDITDRLKRYYKVSTDKELAERVGININTLKTWKKRDSIPYEKLHKVAQNETFSFDWLLTGEECLGATNDTSDLVQIPEYGIQLSAGYGAYPDEHALEVGKRPFSKVWLCKKGLREGDLKLLRVSGDSMEPLLKDKDIVMIDISKTRPTEAMPFAVRLHGDLLVKTIQRQANGDIVLVSRNKEYNDIVVSTNQPPDDFTIIGAVVWHAHSWL